MKEEHEQQRDHQHARVAELLADGRHHQVRVPGRDHSRIALSRARSKRSAGGERPVGVRDLIAAANVVVPRRGPHRDAVHHGVRRLCPIAHVHTAHQQHQPHHGQSGPAARDGEHRQEQKPGHQRRPQILQDEEHQQRAAGGPHHRQGVTKTRQVEPPQPGRKQVFLTQVAQPFPFAREVRRHEEHQQDLDRLHRLERPQVHLRVTSGRPRPPQHQRHEQSESGQQRRVDLPRETAVIEQLQQWQ